MAGPHWKLASSSGSEITKGVRCFQLDDTVLKMIETAEQPELQQAREVVLRMRRRQLYQVHLCDINSRINIHQNTLEFRVRDVGWGYRGDAACFENLKFLYKAGMLGANLK